MTAYADSDDSDDLALAVLQLAADIRRLAERIHHTHGQLLAGHLRHAAMAVEEAYQHVALARPTATVAEPDPCRNGSAMGWDPWSC